MTSGTCEVFSPGKPKDCHASTPAPANATDCATDPLLRYGGLGECGAACNNGHDLCTGPGCFCIYPENCFNQLWITPAPVLKSAAALHRALVKLGDSSLDAVFRARV